MEIKQALDWLLCWFLRSHSWSVSCFVWFVFWCVCVLVYVNGAAFIWFWKYATSHAVSKKKTVFFSVYIAVGLYWLEYLPLHKNLFIQETKPAFLLPSLPARSCMKSCHVAHRSHSSNSVTCTNPTLTPVFLELMLTIPLGNDRRKLDGLKYYWWAAEGLATVFVDSWGNWPCILY